MNKDKTLKIFSTEELMEEVAKRDDIIIIGNWFYREHIKEAMIHLNIKPTNAKLDKVMQEKNLGIDFAREDLENYLWEEIENLRNYL